MVAERLHLLPPFRWRLVEVPFGLDHPYWVEDPDFDLDFHIRESAVPPPGDDAAARRARSSRIFARPLDRARPLWELYLIHGLPDGKVALLTKVHHAVVDGMSRRRDHVASCSTSTPEGREIPPDRERRRRRARPGAARDARPRRRRPARMQPLRALRALPSTLPGPRPTVPGADAFPVVRRRCCQGPLQAARHGRRARRRATILERTSARGAADVVQRPDLAAPALRVRLAAARHASRTIKNAARASRSTTSS